MKFVNLTGNTDDLTTEQVKHRLAIGQFIATTLAALLTLVISIIALKFLWGWTVSDILPGAVEQGLIVAELSWLAAIKIALLVGFTIGAATTLIRQAQTQVHIR